jgi:hypothetical protein
VNKYALAVLACFGIFMVYVFIGVALGWRHGGGYFPMIILLVALGGTWKAITGKKTDENKDNK